jgi:N-acetylglucosaminyl-diphospho-decaprenol L-rhamnosyltransferase
MPDTIDLSIIIINWRSKDFLRKCLASIYANTRDVPFEIIVIDNASFDGSEEMVHREFPEVQFIQSAENLGFARANNLGFDRSKGQNILFLNPDTEVSDGAIRALLAALDSRPDAGIMGCKLLNSDLSVQTSCIQSYPTLLNQVFDADYLRRIFPKSSLWGTQPLYEVQEGPAKVEVVSGACLLIRREAFEKAGLFSETYFMYAEDVDVCYKVKSSGWGVYYLASATVIHHGGQSSSKKTENNFATIMTRESLYNFMKVRRGKLYAVAFRLTLGLAAFCRILMLGSIMVLTLGRFGRDSLPLAMRKWSGVFRWAVGLEEWARGSA